MVDAGITRLSLTGVRDRLRIGAGLLVLAGVVLVLDSSGPPTIAFLVGSAVLAAVIVAGGDGPVAVVASELGGSIGLFLVISLFDANLFATGAGLLGSLLLVSTAGRSLVSEAVEPSARLSRAATAGAAVVALVQVRGIGSWHVYLGLIGNPRMEVLPPTAGGLLFVVAAPVLSIVFALAWGWTSAHLAVAFLAWLPVGTATGAFYVAGPFTGGQSLHVTIVALVLSCLAAILLAGILEIGRELRLATGGEPFSAMPSDDPE